MARGAEAYLQMWERAEGVPDPQCRPRRARLGRWGLGSVRLGYTPKELLLRAGQPESRERAWSYCVSGSRNQTAKVVAAFTPRGRVGLVLSTSRGHVSGRISPGSRARTLRGRARSIGPNLWLRGRFVYGVRRGRVRYVGVAAHSVSSSPRRLRKYLRLAGLR